MVLKFIKLLTQEAYSGDKTLVGARHGFNKLICLEITMTVRHGCPMGETFSFHHYNHWGKLILRRTEQPLVTLLIRKTFSQGDPLLMVLYRITLVPLAKDLRAASPGIITPFYTDGAT